MIMKKTTNDNITIMDFPNEITWKPITSYFIETSKKIKDASGENWLKNVDGDTLKILQSSFDKLRYEESDEEFKGYSDESIDILGTTFFLACWEMKVEKIPSDKFKEFVALFDVTTTLESLRRKGLVNKNCDEKISETGSSWQITADGIDIMKLLKSKTKKIKSED